MAARRRVRKGIWDDGATSVPAEKAGAWAAAKHIPPVEFDYPALVTECGSHAAARRRMAALAAEQVMRKQNGAERIIRRTAVVQQAELAKRREVTQGFAIARQAPIAQVASGIAFGPPMARQSERAAREERKRKARRTHHQFIVDRAVRKAFTSRRLMLGGQGITEDALGKLGNTMFMQVRIWTCW